MATQDADPPRYQAAVGLPTEGAVRIGPIMGLPRLLTEHGIDADATIRSLGCDPALFADADNSLPFAVVGLLLAQTAAVTGCRYPGLQVCQHWGTEALGVVGRTVRLAPDLGSALRCLIRSLHLHDRGAVPYLWTSHEQAVFGYTFYCSDVIGTAHIYDTALAIGFNLISELAGPEWRATEVRHFREQSTDLKPFREQFVARVQFGAPLAAIVFPKSDLKLPLAGADPDRYAAALVELAALDTRSGDGIAHKVRRELLRLLASGAGGGVDAFGREAMAAMFALHPRTLNRRLRAEGTTFSAELARARYDIARELLRATRLQVGDIAAALGYAETASFDRAFRHWSGTTASAWRARCGPR
jgi:AraC-like DNA-binding protein